MRSPVLKPLLISIVGSTIALLPPPLQAMGFGAVGGGALIGRPLDFSTTVRLEPDEVLDQGCVRAEVLSGESRLDAAQTRVSVNAGASTSERRILVTTTDRIDEPVVTVTLTLGCTSRLTRKFVVFLDLPLTNLAAASEVQSQPAPGRAESNPAPVDTAIPVPPVRQEADAPRPANQDATSRAPRTSVARAARPRQHPAAVASPARPARKVASVWHAPKTVAVAAAGPRLHLEPARPAADSKPPAPATAEPGVPPQSPLSLLAGELEDLRGSLAKERQRTEDFERTLSRLQAQQAANQQAVAGLQAKLHQAEADRYANPLVYGLAALTTLLLLLVGFLLSRGRRGSSSRWWDAPRNASSEDAADSRPQAGSGRLLDEDPAWMHQSPKKTVTAPPSKPSDIAWAIGGLEVTAVMDQALLGGISTPDIKARAAETRSPIPKLEAVMDEHVPAQEVSPHSPAVDIQFPDLPGMESQQRDSQQRESTPHHSPQHDSALHDMALHDSIQPGLELPTVLDVDLTLAMDDGPEQQPTRSTGKGKLEH